MKPLQSLGSNQAADQNVCFFSSGSRASGLKYAVYKLQRPNRVKKPLGVNVACRILYTAY